jgi:hypothetical protein
MPPMSRTPEVSDAQDGMLVDPAETLVDLSAGPLAGTVLSRVAGALAAQAGLRLDRLADATLLAEALAAHGARHARDGRLMTRLSVAPGRLSIRFGPLGPGGAEALRRDATLPDVGSVLDRLADEVAVEGGAGGEVLVLRIAS